MDKTKVVIYSTRRTLGDMISDMISDSDSLVVTCSTPEQTVTACLRLAPDIVILLAVAVCGVAFGISGYNRKIKSIT